MSTQSGLRAVELVQQGKKVDGTGIKLVGVSGQGPDARVHAHAAGFDEFHTKPLEMSVLENLFT